MTLEHKNRRTKDSSLKLFWQLFLCLDSLGPNPKPPFKMATIVNHLSLIVIFSLYIYIVVFVLSLLKMDILLLLLLD